MAKTFKEQFVTLYVALDEVPADESDALNAQVMALNRIHDAAFKLVEQLGPRIPGFRANEFEMSAPGVTAFELCEDEGVATFVEGIQAWSVCLYATQRISLATLIEMRDLVLHCYARAGSEAGRADLKARFIKAEARDTYSLVEDSVVAGL